MSIDRSSTYNDPRDGVFGSLFGHKDWSRFSSRDEGLYSKFCLLDDDIWSYEANWAFYRQEARLAAAQYCDGEVLVPVVVKDFDSQYVFILAPLGDQSGFVAKARALCELLSGATGRMVVIRKAQPSTYGALLRSDDYVVLASSAFLSPRDFPEDAYPQVIVDLAMVLSLRGGRFVSLRNHLTHLARNHVVEVCPAQAVERRLLHGLVERWASEHNARTRSLQPSTNITVDVTAYTVFVDDFVARVDGDNYFAVALKVDGEVMGFSFAGRVSGSTAALYCSIASSGPRGASDSLHVAMFRELRRCGIEYLNLGGSEAEGLFRYKSKFGGAGVRGGQEVLFRADRSSLSSERQRDTLSP